MDENEKRSIVKAIDPEHTGELSQTSRLIITPDKNIKFDIEKLAKDNGIVYINQSLINSDGNIVVPTNKVMVQIKEGYELADVIEKSGINMETYRRLGHNERAYLGLVNK